MRTCWKPAWTCRAVAWRASSRSRRQKENGPRSGPFRVPRRTPGGLLLQPGILAQRVGAVGLFPREGGGLLLLAGAVGVADFLGLAAEVAVAGGRLVDRVLQVQHLGDA